MSQCEIKTKKEHVNYDELDIVTIIM